LGPTFSTDIETEKSENTSNKSKKCPAPDDALYDDHF
jgi:hypothetical protein